MPHFRCTFKGSNGDLRIVFADSEPEARSLAMEQRWGKCPQSLKVCTPSTHHLGRGAPEKRRHFTFTEWKGHGLDLIDVTPVLSVTE